MRGPVTAFSLCLALVAPGAAGAERASPIEPSDWLNYDGPGKLSWDALKGRLILVEKWATW